MYVRWALPATFHPQLALKQALVAPTGIDVARMRLIHLGRLLSNEKTVAFYNIKSGSTMHLIGRPADFDPSQRSTSPRGGGGGRRRSASMPAAGLPPNVSIIIHHGRGRTTAPR